MTNNTYRYFSFPNKLTPLESYFYYLKEFDVIPNVIKENKIEEIFKAAAIDFVNGQISQSILSVIVSNMYFSGNTPDLLKKVNPQLGWLMDFICELPWDEKNNPKRYIKTLQLLNQYLDDFETFQKSISEISKQ